MTNSQFKKLGPNFCCSNCWALNPAYSILDLVNNKYNHVDVIGLRKTNMYRSRRHRNSREFWSRDKFETTGQSTNQDPDKS